MHILDGHVGPNQTLSTVRNKVWIVSGRGVVNKVKKIVGCANCILLDYTKLHIFPICLKLGCRLAVHSRIVELTCQGIILYTKKG